ncbi:MAG: ATP-binding cassette domain-containing protein, partial [Dehalococcoidia bacterium]
RARQLLEELGVGPRRGHRPEQLSGGEKQRVAIATAIANEPELLLGDELTGELDTKNTDAVLDALATLNERGMTLVIVTHNMRVARRATRILHIKDGLIEESEGAHVGQA